MFYLRLYWFLFVGRVSDKVVKVSISIFLSEFKIFVISPFFFNMSLNSVSFSTLLSVPTVVSDFVPFILLYVQIS